MADVWEWEWSTYGVIELVWTRIPKKLRETALDRSPDQCRYDSVFNCWDVCDYFGPDVPDDDDDEDYYGGGGNSGNDDMNVDLDVVPDRNAVDAFIDERIGQLINCRFALGTAPSSDQGPEVNLTQESNCIDILKYMSTFYGFVAPLPIPLTDTVLIEQHDWDECLKSVGLQNGIHPPSPVSPVLLWSSSGTCKEVVHWNLNGTFWQEIASL